MHRVQVVVGGIPGGGRAVGERAEHVHGDLPDEVVAVPEIPCGWSPKIASTQRIVPALKTPALLRACSRRSRRNC